MSGSGANGREWTQSTSGEIGLREEKAPSYPVTQMREISLQAWGLQVVGSSTLMASICFLCIFFLKQEVKSEGKEHLKETHHGGDKNGS